MSEEFVQSMQATEVAEASAVKKSTKNRAKSAINAALRVRRSSTRYSEFMRCF